LINRTFKAAICDIIVVFLFFIILINVIQLAGKEQITAIQSTISMFESKISNSNKKIEIDPIRKRLKDYPDVDSQYGTVIIEKLGVELPLYYGNSYSILRNGIGQYTNSFCPGEGGAIICMGHNFDGFLRRLGELDNGDIISINTNYGSYDYRVYASKIIDETDFDSTPVVDDQELLYLFTCYPFNNIGYADKRYVVYAKLVEGGIN